MTVSIGVATRSEGIKELKQLMIQVDLALYRAKNQGRNQVCVV